MATQYLPVSVIALWLTLALSALSISRAAVGDIATQSFFNGILSTVTDSYAGKTFYTYRLTVTSLMHWLHSLALAHVDNQKREIDAFLANFAH